MLVSVYITSYNQKEYLREAIDSVLRQTLQPFEIIIVDDCSTDGSVELISSYAIKYPNLFRPFFNETNKGVSYVRSRALNAVKGDYVTYLDGDDLFGPSKLELESRLIDGGKYDIAFSNTAYFTKEISNIERIWAADLLKMPSPGNMYYETFCRLFPRDSLFRMELVNYGLWKKLGFHDPNLKIYEDFDMRIRLSKHAKINYTLAPLAYVRVDSHNLSKRPAGLHLESYKYIYAKHLKDVSLQFPDRVKEIEHRYKIFFKEFSRRSLSKSNKTCLKNRIKKYVKKLF